MPGWGPANTRIHSPSPARGPATEVAYLKSTQPGNLFEVETDDTVVRRSFWKYDSGGKVLSVHEMNKVPLCIVCRSIVLHDIEQVSYIHILASR